MLVILKKVGMLILLGILFTACSIKEPSNPNIGAMFKVKPKKVCATCVAIGFEDDNS